MSTVLIQIQVRTQGPAARRRTRYPGARDPCRSACCKPRSGIPARVGLPVLVLVGIAIAIPE
eukprot:2409133-Rhodomonas_salina.4